MTDKPNFEYELYVNGELKAASHDPAIIEDWLKRERRMRVVAAAAPQPGDPLIQVPPLEGGVYSSVVEPDTLYFTLKCSGCGNENRFELYAPAQPIRICCSLCGKGIPSTRSNSLSFRRTSAPITALTGPIYDFAGGD
jgi:hypothetical protein